MLQTIVDWVEVLGNPTDNCLQRWVALRLTQPCILKEVVDHPNLGQNRPLRSKGHYHNYNFCVIYRRVIKSGCYSESPIVKCHPSPQNYYFFASGAGCLLGCRAAVQIYDLFFG